MNPGTSKKHRSQSRCPPALRKKMRMSRRLKKRTTRKRTARRRFQHTLIYISREVTESFNGINVWVTRKARWRKMISLVASVSMKGLTLNCSRLLTKTLKSVRHIGSLKRDPDKNRKRGTCQASVPFPRTHLDSIPPHGNVDWKASNLDYRELDNFCRYAIRTQNCESWNIRIRISPGIKIRER